MDQTAAKPARKPRRLHTVAGVLLLGALPTLMGSEGGCTLLQDTLTSPIQAVTILTEQPDGTVNANLIVVSTEGGDSRFVTSVTDAEIRTPDGDIVTLEQSRDGHYIASSADDSSLVYDSSGTNYRISFELDDEDAAGDRAGDEFSAVVLPPDEEVTFEFTKLPEFAGDTAKIEWTPSRLAGLMQIYKDGELVYSTFDWEHPEFDGSKWGSMIYGGREDLRVDVFADPGDYVVKFCAVESKEGLEEEVSAGLGIASGFLAGRCVDDVRIEVAQ